MITTTTFMLIFPQLGIVSGMSKHVTIIPRMLHELAVSFLDVQL